VAAAIKKVTGIDPELIEGRRGEFTVWVGDSQVAGKDEDNFPSENEVVEAVRRAVGG
jgi:hypothetical protein